MKNRKVVAHAQRLEVLFQRVDALDADPESIAHWSRYLCVLVSGFIEVSIRTILLDYADKRADPTVARFVGSHLRAFQNAKAGKILELLGRFGTDKRERLEQQLDGLKLNSRRQD